MKAFTADFDLSLKTGEVVLVKPEEFAFATQHYQAFHRLGKQKLVMERYVRTTILQGKNNPDSHNLFH